MLKKVSILALSLCAMAFTPSVFAASEALKDVRVERDKSE